jgi:hypothetical protein
MVLGVVVAIGVALLFIVVMGADTGQRAAAGASHRAPLDPGEVQAGASRLALLPDAK